MTTYKVSFNYSHYQWSHFWGEKLFEASSLDEARTLAENFINERKDEVRPYIHKITQVDA